MKLALIDIEPFEAQYKAAHEKSCTIESRTESNRWDTIAVCWAVCIKAASEETLMALLRQAYVAGQQHAWQYEGSLTFEQWLQQKKGGQSGND